ncbi:maleylacetoacetate isomerase [Sphingomonas sp.]|uniref:maleylacetoacetate isomerase n=1 Tax=Sphingomonas sp. TaxID=28214 RepID=UPI003B3BE7DD
MTMLRLHGYWRSSAAYRVRIALALKGLSYTQTGHDLRTNGHKEAAYRAIAPAGLVPALETDEDVFVQSLAIIEWLDETYPHPPLLPPDATGRVIVRGMAQTIACDIHPLNNLRILRYLKSDLGASQEVIDGWAARWIGDGFAALEKMIARHGGVFAYGDAPTLADCLTVPQAYNAARFGVDLSPYPRLMATVERVRAIDAVAAAHPDRQPDADRA